ACRAVIGSEPAASGGAPQVIGELFARLDQLIIVVADDATLCGGLLRERARLQLHLESRLGYTGAIPRFPGAVKIHSTPRSYRRLRLACYRALSTGLVDARRFDSLMLLGARAGRPPAAAQNGSLSSPSGPSGLESADSAARGAAKPLGGALSGS